MKREFGFQDAPLDTRLGTAGLRLSPRTQQVEFQKRSADEIKLLKRTS